MASATKKAITMPGGAANQRAHGHENARQSGQQQARFWHSSSASIVSSPGWRPTIDLRPQALRNMVSMMANSQGRQDAQVAPIHGQATAGKAADAGGAACPAGGRGAAPAGRCRKSAAPRRPRRSAAAKAPTRPATATGKRTASPPTFDPVSLRAGMLACIARGGLPSCHGPGSRCELRTPAPNSPCCQPLAAGPRELADRRCLASLP